MAGALVRPCTFAWLHPISPAYRTLWPVDLAAAVHILRALYLSSDVIAVGAEGALRLVGAALCASP